jgi:GTP-binding protein HflX
VAAFRATLEEVNEADLLLHVVDASAEDMEEREAAVGVVLKEIGADERPVVCVLNKADRLPPGRPASLGTARPDAVLISAQSRVGLDDLKARLAARLEMAPRSVRLCFRADEARGIAGVYAAGRVVRHEVEGDRVTIEAEIPERFLSRYRGHLS